MNQLSPIERCVAPDVRPLLLCFSHLRWNFVFQRPQHLMQRATRTHQVFFVEEPLHAAEHPHFRMRIEPSGVSVLTPVFDQRCDALKEQHDLVAGLIRALQPREIVTWFYTPMALRFAAALPSDLIVYDCMDELSAFRFAPPELGELERHLIARADLVFTGGASLYAAKAGLHGDVSCFPSSVDAAHFAQARQPIADPEDQTVIARPRIGYFGVIDERMDLRLVGQVAAAMPDIQFVMLGPVVKVSHDDLPKAANLHWLGRKEYRDLPAYMANWQAAWMPFALNESTRFISPTKTPEFLAAGLPVTSTAVPDVVADWGKPGLVRIADASSMVDALRSSLSPAAADSAVRVDARLADLSWDRTWSEMAQKMGARMRVLVRS